MSVEVWLRGPLDGIPAEVMPIAHALLQAAEDVAEHVALLDRDALWARPGGAASIGWHVTHLTGATDRLFTYARGEPLDRAQRAVLEIEREGGDQSQSAEALVSSFERTIDTCLGELESVESSTLDDARAIGAKQLPTTVRGLLTHAAEHAARHVGQIVTTLKVMG